MIRIHGVGFNPKEQETNGGMDSKRKERLKKRETYEVVYPMTARRNCAALVITDNITTDLLVIAVVGVGTCYDHTPVCALGRQARARDW